MGHREQQGVTLLLQISLFSPPRSPEQLPHKKVNASTQSSLEKESGKGLRITSRRGFFWPERPGSWGARFLRARARAGRWDRQSGGPLTWKALEVEPPRLARTLADRQLPEMDRLPDRFLHFSRALYFSRSSPRRLPISPTLGGEVRKKAQFPHFFPRLTTFFLQELQAPSPPDRWSAWGSEAGSLHAEPTWSPRSWCTRPRR